MNTSAISYPTFFDQFWLLLLCPTHTHTLIVTPDSSFTDLASQMRCVWLSTQRSLLLSSPISHLSHISPSVSHILFSVSPVSTLAYISPTLTQTRIYCFPSPHSLASSSPSPVSIYISGSHLCITTLIRTLSPAWFWLCYSVLYRLLSSGGQRRTITHSFQCAYNLCFSTFDHPLLFFGCLSTLFHL